MKAYFKLSLFTVIFFITFISLFVSCGTARRSEPIMGMMVKNEQVLNGEKVFMTNCQQCHPGGEAGLGPPINNVPLPGFTKRIRIRSKAFLLGLGRMPSFKKHEISRQEMDDLIVYMHALKKNDEDARGSKKGNKDFTKK
ncbi:MAG: c-type cytochrome [Cytophagaceae bacterium]|nr:c-type cytochrome [Cytophagaceae bacterium]